MNCHAACLKGTIFAKFRQDFHIVIKLYITIPYQIMKPIVAITITLLSIHFLASCNKQDIDDGNPNPPGGSVYGTPPSAFTFLAPDLKSTSISFDYSKLPDKVSVYFDDTLTDNPYDRIYASYTFNNDGYLTENIFYNETGEAINNITIVRDGNQISGIVLSHEDKNAPGKIITDTFYVSFQDSTEYKLMQVDYGNYFAGVPVEMKFTYRKDELIHSTAGLFTLGDSAVFFPSFDFSYNNAGVLQSRWSDSYYGMDYAYNDSGKGLDSLFKTLGGKDWHYLESILNYDEHTTLFFYPLYITLSKAGMDLDVYMHHYGPLREIRSIPSGYQYPDIEIFNFENTFDDEGKIVETTISNNGKVYGTYRFSY